MDEQRIEDFRKRLLEEQRALLSLQEAGEEATKTVELDQSSVGRLSRMDALQGQAMSQETERRRKLELQRIASALERIETGDYGHCLQCEAEIDVRRLEFDPATPLCIECASAADKGAD